MRRQILILSGCLIVLSLWAAHHSSAQSVTGYENPYYTTGAELSPPRSCPLCASGTCHNAYTRCMTGAKSNIPTMRAITTSATGRVSRRYPFYDIYGDYITQGWLVYDWTEDYPVDNGSIITGNRFRSWFNNLLISCSIRASSTLRSW